MALAIPAIPLVDGDVTINFSRPDLSPLILDILAVIPFLIGMGGGGSLLVE